MTVADIERIGSPQISRQQAREAFLAYKRGILSETDAVRKREYEALMRGYRAIARGQTVLDLHLAMRHAGLQPGTFPKLAICRADAKKCSVYLRPDGSAVFAADKDARWVYEREKKAVVRLPVDTFERRQSSGTAEAIVPIIPPSLRPKSDIGNYHIIWDAVWTKAAPVDPLLVRHLQGSLYAIVAAWDLTPLERAVLMGRL